MTERQYDVHTNSNTDSTESNDSNSDRVSRPLLLRFICRPPIKDIVLALAGLFEVLFCLFLHFVLLVYNFLVHIIGFSK